MITEWLFRRRNRCRVHYNAQDPYEMTCRTHGFSTQSSTELQDHKLAEITKTERALLR